MHGVPVLENPDSGATVIGTKIRGLERVLGIAVAAADETGLGYLGADVVVDALGGPMILELNARPGLAIQLANGAGLRPRLEAVDARLGWPHGDPERRLPLAERVALGQEISDTVTRSRTRGRRLA
jgi:hypothetical protein